MEREEELEQTIDELNYRLTNALKKIDRLKSSINQAREEIDDLYRYYDNDYCSGNKDSMFKCDEVLEILDKLIESEG